MAITVDTVEHSALDSTILVGTEGSDAGNLAKDISAFLATGDNIISVSHCFNPQSNTILTSIIRELDD